MMCAARQLGGGQFRAQDGHLTWSPGEGRDSHAQHRWRARAPAEFEDMDVRVAWREGVPVDFPQMESERSYARYHQESEMVLIAEFGFIETVVNLFDDAPEHATAAVLEQINAMGGDR